MRPTAEQKANMARLRLELKKANARSIELLAAIKEIDERKKAKTETPTESIESETPSVQEEIK